MLLHVQAIKSPLQYIVNCMYHDVHYVISSSFLFFISVMSNFLLSTLFFILSVPFLYLESQTNV
jgi:hypothetical protein